MRDHYGKGLGGAMLSAAVEAVWELPGTQRVWVHTSSYDHPAALANYVNRGFRLYDTKNPETAD